MFDPSLPHSRVSYVLFFSLLRIGDKYDIKSLVKKCSDELSQNLNLHDVIDILYTADSVNAGQLKNTAITYIATNLRVS